MATLSAWNKTTLPVSARWVGIAYGGGMFVAASNGGGLMYSVDGKSWTNIDVSGNFNCICYGAGKFIAIESMFVATSSDGKIWTKQESDLPTNTTWKSVAYGNGRFVAVSTTGDAAYSIDGVEWTSKSTGALSALNAIVYTGTRFVAVGFKTICTSDDGVAWSFKSQPVSDTWTSMAYGEGIVVVSGETYEIISSDGGLNWSLTTIQHNNYSGIAYGNGMFVAVSKNNKYSDYSTDRATTWNTADLPVSGVWHIAAAGPVFVAIADNVTTAAYCVTNTPPSAPNSINVPTAVDGGKTLDVSWGDSTDPDKNLAGYRLERKVDTGEWTQIYQGTLRTFTDTITFGWGTVTYRIKAYDQAGSESGYTTSPARTVTNNRAPTISGSDGSIGTFSSSFTAQSYTVNDADSDAVTVVETLDGVQLRSYKPTLGQANNLTFTADAWRNIRNGTHTLVITATDPKGAKAVRTWTFIKAYNSLNLSLVTPLSADSQPLRCIVTVLGAWPSGSTLKVEVCNNANDAKPTWEDITSKVLAGQKHTFSNNKKTATTWAVNVRVTLARGSASGDCYIESVSGNFE